MKFLWLLCAVATALQARSISAGDYPTFAAALGAGRHDSVINLPEGYRAQLHSQLTIAGSNVTIHCANRAAITKAFDGEALKITGRNIVIDGCTFDGQRSVYRGGLLNLTGARGVVIQKSILFNAAGVAIGIYGSSSVRILDNTITGNQGSALFAQDDVDNLEIASNTIDSSTVDQPPGIDTIGIHTYRVNGTASNINIHDNQIRHGGQNFAIEVGAFGLGAVPPDGVTVRKNTIALTIPSSGGVSLSTIKNGSVLDNSIDAGGNRMNIAAIELVSTVNVTVSGNTFVHAAPNTAYTMSIDGGSENRILNNHMDGGIYVGTSRTGSSHVDNNVIEGNVLTAPGGSDFARGFIWLQCNTLNCSLSRNQIRNNRLGGVPATIGVNLENDYPGHGVMEGNQVYANQVSGGGKNIAIGGATNTVTSPP